MLTIDPQDAGNRQSFKYLLGGVAPRPIAFVSTISENGVNNLAPFSFFNAFGSNPPVLAFSASRRGTNNTTKDTYENLVRTKECVIHTVNYSMLEQMNLASSEFGSDVDEFVKSGFTPVKSENVKPMRVGESPVHFECELMQMVELGGLAGSGNLAVCKVVKIHISKDILDENQAIDPHKLDAIGRNGGAFYTRASGSALFEAQKPRGNGIGYDELPDFIKNSNVYTANNLGLFAMTQKNPSSEEVESFVKNIEVKESSEETFYMQDRLGDYKNMFASVLYLESQNNPKSHYFFELTAQKALEARDLDFAWNVAIHSGKKSK
jgi:flavin reductase (DIM6/NTAB) family NADH-FMN oxidoreductase RutF